MNKVMATALSVCVFALGSMLAAPVQANTSYLPDCNNDNMWQTYSFTIYGSRAEYWTYLCTPEGWWLVDLTICGTECNQA